MGQSGLDHDPRNAQLPSPSSPSSSPGVIIQFRSQFLQFLRFCFQTLDLLQWPYGAPSVWIWCGSDHYSGFYSTFFRSGDSLHCSNPGSNPSLGDFFFSSPFSFHFSFFQLSLSFNEDINYFQCEFGVDLIISLDFTGLGNLEVTNFQTLLLVKADQ